MSGDAIREGLLAKWAEASSNTARLDCFCSLLELKRACLDPGPGQQGSPCHASLWHCMDIDSACVPSQQWWRPAEFRDFLGGSFQLRYPITHVHLASISTSPWRSLDIEGEASPIFPSFDLNWTSQGLNCWINVWATMGFITTYLVKYFEVMGLGPI